MKSDGQAVSPISHVLLAFRLGGDVFLIPLNAVDRVVQMVALRAVPGTPPELPGFVTVHGSVQPVLDIRARFGLPLHTPDITDHLLLLRTEPHRMALLVEEALDLITSEDWQPSTDMLPETLTNALPWIAGMALYEDTMRVILNVDALMSFVPTHIVSSIVSEPE